MGIREEWREARHGDVIAQDLWHVLIPDVSLTGEL